jgi:hypothetical protein
LLGKALDCLAKSLLAFAQQLAGQFRRASHKKDFNAATEDDEQDGLKSEVYFSLVHPRQPVQI